jgi:hypothetical protein
MDRGHDRIPRSHSRPLTMPEVSDTRLTSDLLPSTRYSVATVSMLMPNSWLTFVIFFVVLLISLVR